MLCGTELSGSLSINGDFRDFIIFLFQICCLKHELWQVPVVAFVGEKELVVLVWCDSPIWVASRLSVHTISSILFGRGWSTFTSPIAATYSRVRGRSLRSFHTPAALITLLQPYTHTHTHRMSPVFIYWRKIRQMTDLLLLLLLLEQVPGCLNSVTEFLSKTWRAWCSNWKQVNGGGRGEEYLVP
jgi:hypothetical protein